MLNHMRCCFIHASCAARRAYPSAFAGKRYQKIMATIATAGSGEAMRKHATFQILAKGLLRKWRGRVMITLPVKLASAR
jgi:hypothetical protein